MKMNYVRIHLVHINVYVRLDTYSITIDVLMSMNVPMGHVTQTLFVLTRKAVSHVNAQVDSVVMV